MGKKKGFALRIDEQVLAALEKWAADEFRSTNGQIEWILAQALHRAGRLPKIATSQNPDISETNQATTLNDEETPQNS